MVRRFGFESSYTLAFFEMAEELEENEENDRVLEMVMNDAITEANEDEEEED